MAICPFTGLFLVAIHTVRCRCGMPSQVLVNLRTNAERDTGPTVAFSSHHLDKLAAASQQHTQCLGGRIRQRPHTTPSRRKPATGPTNALRGARTRNPGHQLRTSNASPAPPLQESACMLVTRP